jgi:hypothetical protein
MYPTKHTHHKTPPQISFFYMWPFFKPPLHWSYQEKTETLVLKILAFTSLFFHNFLSKFESFE